MSKLAIKQSSKQLFTLNENEALEQTNSFFRQLNNHSSCDLRLTNDRLARTIPNALKAIGASHAEIFLITNHRLTHAERSLSYYHTTPKNLESTYSRAVDWLKRYISGNPISTAKDSSAINSSDLILGSGLRLSKKLAQTVTKHLLKNVNMSRSRYSQFTNGNKSKKLIEFHNHLTYYTVKLFQFSSGFRAVNDPLENINQVDNQTGFISISDKDGDSFRHSRIVQLTPRCLEQLNAYALHLNNLGKHSNNQNLLKHLYSVFLKPDETKFGFLFYLDDDENPLRATPDQMKKYAIHNLPNNIYRHFLRTELQHKGVPSELTSYFLGHWELGEEPFQKFSTLSPIEFAVEITPVIQELQIEIGWTVQHGVR